MWTAALRKSWLQATRLYDAWFALADRGLKGIRGLLREIGTYRLLPKESKKPKAPYLTPTLEALETREMLATSIDSIVRFNDPRDLTLVPGGLLPKNWSRCYESL